jgi:hypothetical protein
MGFVVCAARSEQHALKHKEIKSFRIQYIIYMRLN